MSLPRTYRNIGEGSIASYDAIDLIEGTGIVKLYGGGTADSVGTKLRLERNTFHTSFSVNSTTLQNQTRAAFSGTDATKVIDLDFDTGEFNLPATINGTAMCNIPIAATSANSDSGGTAYAIVTYKKVSSAGTETDLIATTSATGGWSYAAGLQNLYISMLSILPLTHFKKGEKLRITIEIWGLRTGASHAQGFMVCYDPLNLVIPAQTGSAADNILNQSAGFTMMQFLIPFRIDL